MERRPHYRKDTRLPGFDYATPGSYFVTIVVKDRRPILGHIGPNEAHTLSDAGHMVVNAWLATGEMTDGASCDEFIVMPDHMHGIVNLGDDPKVTQVATLATFVHRFKSYSTNAYGMGVRDYGWTPYVGRLWQVNCFERIIRHDRELEKFRAYIRNNPRRWAERRAVDA